MIPKHYLAAMKVELIQPEPNLEFGDGNEFIDMRFGIGCFGTLDYADSNGPRQIKLGFVGSDESLGSLIDWVEKCKFEIPAKPSKQPRLFPPFPGFGSNHSFHSTLTWSSRESRIVTIPDDAKKGTFNEVVSNISELYVKEIATLIESSKVDVVLCAPPIEHLKLVLKTGAEDSTPFASDTRGDELPEKTWHDFHDQLKARSLHLRVPLQYILPATYDESKIARQKKLKNRDQQDEATRAWNLFTAIYYKAGGLPWRMTRTDADVRSCYLGISFFHTLDKERLYASSAQVFNELGEGVIVRGGLAVKDKNDRTIHLDEEGAYSLIKLALEAFKKEHGHLPARVVVHKSSDYSEGEYRGLSRFLKEKEITHFDLLYLSESFIRLYRPETYPPLRGTLWQLDDRRTILYTKGSVPFYETYPATYPPKSLYIDTTHAQRPIRDLARECLALTKMNWNNTRFDGQLPITLRAARQVGTILKYLEGEDTSKVSQSYRFYM